jgi:protein-tyrosine phosphatase
MAADQPPAEPFRLLFVCSGNTCRSPMAEAIARRAVGDRGWRHIEVRSAGTGAVAGSPPSDGARAAAARHGLDLDGHRASPLTPDSLAWADLVLTMSPSHLLRVVELGGGDKASLLTAFAAGDDPDGIPASVADPFGGSDDEYEATFTLLERLIERALRRLEPIVAP